MTDDRILLAMTFREVELVKRGLVVLAPFLETAEDDRLRADMVEILDGELDRRAVAALAPYLTDS